MKELLLVAVIHVVTRPVQSVNGVIWDKKINDFVPIFSIPVFATMNQELLNRSREMETHNFQGNVIRLTYFEIKNLINKKNNGREITGAIGAIWNTLSELLNFTLKPTLVEDAILGYQRDSGIYMTGLLKIIENNETDVIPRIETHKSHLAAVQFSMPLWITSYNVYIKGGMEPLSTWMLKLFSWKIWYAILIIYFLLSICSYLTQTINSKITQTKSSASFHDHFFYNFGLICSQSYLPNGSNTSSKIVELWLGLFSLLVRTYFSALLIIYLTKIIPTYPFHDLKSLLNNSSYNIVAVNETLLTFQLLYNNSYQKEIEMNRLKIVKTNTELYETVCSSDKLYAMLETMDVTLTSNPHICPLHTVENPIAIIPIVSGISRNFTYKRSIDIGILKMYEGGIIKEILTYWKDMNNPRKNEPNIIEPVNLKHTYLIITTFYCGVMISFIIFIFEIVIFHYCN
ncbi:uncharacterized protein LOC143343538 [Colletes latitarsis]|uniref:uncharacterized protein LOC143343538 n=1 Tax=Colletes latitarsis TaxID=2605962 RepID=UPI004036805B